MIDPNQAARELILDQVEVTNLVGNRVWVNRLAPGYTPTEGNPALTVTTQGGVADKYIPGIVEAQVIIRAWASTITEARTVLRAVCVACHALERVDVTGGRVDAALVDGPGQDLVEPDTGVCSVISTWTFYLR